MRENDLNDLTSNLFIQNFVTTPKGLIRSTKNSFVFVISQVIKSTYENWSFSQIYAVFLPIKTQFENFFRNKLNHLIHLRQNLKAKNLNQIIAWMCFWFISDLAA